jgi:hypothetical protein
MGASGESEVRIGLAVSGSASKSIGSASQHYGKGKMKQIGKGLNNIGDILIGDRRF